jgi:hypothetical protein
MGDEFRFLAQNKHPSSVPLFLCSSAPLREIKIISEGQQRQKLN